MTVESTNRTYAERINRDLIPITAAQPPNNRNEVAY